MRIFQAFLDFLNKHFVIIVVVALFLLLAFAIPRAVFPAGPVTIQAEDYDDGGEGVAYHDTTPDNTCDCNGGYREAEGVDVCPNAPDPGCHVGHNKPGEWTTYSVDFPTAGRYRVDLYAACKDRSGAGSLTVGDGDPIAFTVPDTGTWHTFRPVPVDVDIPTPGKHALKVLQGPTFTWDKMVIYKPGGTIAEGLTPLEYATYFAATGTPFSASWDENDPKPDYYEIKLKSVERDVDVPIGTGKTTAPPATVTLPYAGHFVFLVRACATIENALKCGEWTKSTDATAARVDGVLRGWWLYGYTAAPGPPEIGN